MNGKNIISTESNALKMFSTGLLFSCLMLLTCTNFIIYTFGNAVEVEFMSDFSGEEKMPATPEEKSTNNSITIQEEYVHDTDYEIHNLAFNHRTHHTIIEASKLSIVHFELISPPPDTRL